MVNKYALLFVLAILLRLPAGFSQGLENFNNYPETSNAYHDGSFTGQDGSTWNYYQCRGDSVIVAPSPTLGKNRTPTSEVISGTIYNGCGILSFDYKQVFSTSVSMDVLVNGLLVYTAVTTGEQGILKNTGPITVNVSGDIILDFKQHSTAAGQICIDNIIWTEYNAGPLPEPTNYPTAFTATPSPFTISLSWVDAIGEQLPTAYLLLASEFDNIELPVDGIPVPDDPNLMDGFASMNISPGNQAYQFTSLPNNKQYFFKIFPYTNTGSNINYKTDGVPPNTTATTPNITIINSEDFNDGTFGTWTHLTIVGDTAWMIDLIHGVGGTPCAKASGYYGGPHMTEMWLLSPSLNMNHFTGGILSFQTAKNYAGPDLEVLISTDYDGASDPNEFTWSPLAATLSSGGWAWTPSGNVDISMYTGSSIFVAFKFTSTDTESATWEVDDILITAIPSFDLPVVTTNAGFTDITFNSATGGGNVLDDGGSAIIARGLCYSTTPNPTIDGLHTTETGMLGEFSSTMTELTPHTTYYVKAYATSALGTGYGETASFSTLCEPIAPVADFYADTVLVRIGESVNFIDASNNCPSSWDWVFSGGTPETFSGQNPPPIQYNMPGSYAVCLTVVNDYGDSTLCKEGYITVLGPTNAQIVMTEIMYNPPESGTDSLEFLELYNNDQVAWNLNNFYFSRGIVYTFPDYTLEPGAFLLIAKNSTAIQNTFHLPSFQWTDGALNNSGEPVVIKDHLGYVVDSVYYLPVLPWDTLADGYGPSLELCDPGSDNSNPANWRHAIEFQVVNAEGDSIWASPLTGCSYLPVADFTANVTIIPENGVVTFSDASTNTTGWEWTFEGGNPSAFSGQNPPPVQYDIPGQYTVCLVASNDVGASTNCKQDYITVFDPTNTNVVITEIMYNPPGTNADSLQFIELYNNGYVALNLLDFSFTQGITFTLPEILFNPGDYLVVAKNASAIQNTFNKASYQWTDGSLNIQEGPIVLRDNLGFLIDTVYYRSVLPWDTMANGRGSSLELCDPDTDNNDPANWRHAIEFRAINADGDSIWASPLEGCSYLPEADFYADLTTISEHAHVTFTDASSEGTTGWEWTFDGGVPGNFSGQAPPPVQYNTAGVYTVCLVASNVCGNDVECKYNYITVQGPTNAGIVMTEIMYNPPETDNDSLEFIELYNNDDHSWNLQDFFFNQGIQFIFPETFLGPGEYLIVAKNASAVQHTFNVPSLQWTSGSLNNSGEPVVLRDPMGFVVDSVFYLPVLPWDTMADGHGPSLELCDPGADNTNPANWRHALEFQAVNALGDSIWASPLAGCSYPPVADFSADDTVIHLHDFVMFTDESTPDATAWEWTFEGGTPSTYLGQTPPPIQYNTFGLYDVTLTVSNIAGHHTLVKNDYIDVGWVGIDEAGESLQFSIYPNPGNGIFSVVVKSEGPFMIRLLNTLGEVIMESQTHQLVNTFNQSKLAPGVYLIQVTETRSNRISSQKIVIQ